MAWFMLIFFGMAALAVVLVVGVGLLAFLRVRLVPLALSILAGLSLSAMMAGGAGPTAGSTVIASALILVILLSVWPKPRRAAVRARQTYDIDLPPTAAQPSPKRPKSGRAAHTADNLDEPLKTAFEALADNADWARSRIAVAQESCRLFLGLADRHALDSNAGDLAIRIRKRIPEHIGELLAGCELATASERRALLDEGVFTIEKVGAEADRQRARLQGSTVSALDIQRRHLTRKSDDDLFQGD